MSKGIQTEKLNIGYKSDLITDICMKVIPGSIVILIGPNGCGKTTLLKTLTGELRSRGGVVYLGGDDRSSLKASEIAKRVSLVMTYRVRGELMTCREVVETGRYPYTGMLGILSEEDRRKVKEAMEWTGTDSLADSLFDKISDGQKQRVLLARAICQEPGILVLDEVTSYLDIRHKADILSKIRSLAKERNTAVLMSVHELEIARNISDTVIALGEGKLQRIGTPEEVFTESFIRALYHIEGTDTELLGQMPWEDVRTGTGNRGIKAKETTDILHSPKRRGRGRAAAIMIQGTMSNVGKSVIAAGLCRIFSDDGYKVAPFKSQNMALNSYITEEGLEMGRAQVMQAECARVRPVVSMNPVLLKPMGDTRSQVIVGGKAVANMSAAEYYSHKTEFVEDILRAYDSLADEADIIVIEGAGSPVEMNLKKDDIVNMSLAEMVDAPVILVGDIDRGGVFAQILGTLDLFEPKERERIGGVIVNKFRGDRKLFDDGVRILEEKGAAKVIGVVPYMDIKLDDEDSLSERLCRSEAKDFDIAVIKLPYISNFTDFNVFEQLSDVSVRYVSDPAELADPDMIIIPGSKNTIADLRWIKENGLGDAVSKRASSGTCIFGICGGFQMLGRRIEDPDGTECGGEEDGLGLLPVETVLEKEKVRKNITCSISGATGILKGLEDTEVSGYEIHMGKTRPCAELTEFTSGGTGYCRENIYGTYIHGFFDRRDVFVPVVEKIALSRGKTVSAEGAADQADHKDRQYDLLAKCLRENLDMDRIYEIMGLGNDKR